MERTIYIGIRVRVSDLATLHIKFEIFASFCHQIKTNTEPLFIHIFLFLQMRIRTVDDILNKAFFRLGFIVGKHPGYFIVVPVLLTLLCITGYQQIHYNIDPEYLFSPINGAGKFERSIAEKLFQVNYTTRFNVARITRAGKSFYF